LGKYYESPEYISHSGSNKGFINGVYLKVRQYTLLKKLQLISKYFKTGRILDIGSGTGEFLNVMQSAKWDVFGIEPGNVPRETSKVNYKLRVEDEDYLQNLADESFDVITMWHVLEHVPDLNKRVEDIKRLIKKNGIIIIAVPNCSSPDALKYGRDWAAYDVPRHLYHFTPKDIRLLFSNHLLKVDRVLPMPFDSYYVSMLSEKIKGSSLGVLRGFLTGLRSNLQAMNSGEKFSSQIYVIRKN
jgi:SAM-dependent methyltransferase